MIDIAKIVAEGVSSVLGRAAIYRAPGLAPDAPGTAVTLVPRLGVAMTFSLIIAGQMLVTLVIDHFGLLGVPETKVSLARVAGILLITAGVVLIRRF